MAKYLLTNCSALILATVAKYRQEEDKRKHVCNNMGGIYFSGHQRTDGTYVRIEPSWRNGRRIYIVKKELKNGYNEENAYHDLGDAEYYAS